MDWTTPGATAHVHCRGYLGLYPPHVLDSEEVEIKKGMIFDTLEHLKYFLMDYAIRFQRTYYVTHSDQNKRYTMLCKHGCDWGLWA